MADTLRSTALRVKGTKSAKAQIDLRSRRPVMPWVWLLPGRLERDAQSIQKAFAWSARRNVSRAEQDAGGSLCQLAWTATGCDLCRRLPRQASRLLTIRHLAD